MEENPPPMKCEECEGNDFYKEAGHFYCLACQTQSQHVQEHVFDQGGDAPQQKAAKKIQKDKSEKAEDTLTSWECYNYVLKGLAGELVALGAKPALITVVRCLWMKYLHKCEVFDAKSDRPPRVSILGPKKDVAILYNVAKRKRPRSRDAASSAILSVHRQRSKKKKALVQSQYEEQSQSQNLTQNSSLMMDTLSSLKSGDAKASENNVKIDYNRYSKSEFERLMSRNRKKNNLKDFEGKSTSHKPRWRDFRPNFKTGPTSLTTFTPYCLLYIGLLITGDSIQLGDMLRFIREGHLSFGCYRHFFDEASSPKALNLSQRKEKLFSHGLFRKRCAKLVQFLDVSGYIQKPDIAGLCARYCTELNLPREVFECAEKLLMKSDPKFAFDKLSQSIPNYEARAMSFILITLKLLFGLDGVTEKKLSQYAQCLSCTLKPFDLLKWLQFVGYRNEIMKLHHLPSALRDCNSVDSDQYLDYLKNQKVQFKGTSRHIHGEVKDYLQVLDNLLEGLDKRCGDDKVFKFEPSLTPYVSYTDLILDHKMVACRDILSESFLDCSLAFLLRPNGYLALAGTKRIKNSGANDNVVTEDLMYLYKATVFVQKKSREMVPVKLTQQIADDRHVDEYLQPQKPTSLKTTDVNVLLSNWQKSNKKAFSKNKDLLKIASENTAIDPNVNEVYLEHYHPFERYWLNVPINPVTHYLAKQDMNVIAAKFPHSLRTIMAECSRTVEQDLSEFFAEYLMTELYLTNFVEYGCTTKKSKGKGDVEFQRMLVNCKKHW